MKKSNSRFLRVLSALLAFVLVAQIGIIGVCAEGGHAYVISNGTPNTDFEGTRSICEKETFNPLCFLLDLIAKMTGTDENNVATFIKGDVPLYYNTETKILYSDNNKGIFNLGFDYDARANDAYSAANPWQYDYGYNVFYDVAAPFINLVIDTERFYFSYDGKDWLVQLWKGQYGITTGAEIGIYNKDSHDAGVHYQCTRPDECPPMEMKVFRNDKLYMHRESNKFFWLTGFRLLDFTRLDHLRMEGTIHFNSVGMANAFIGAATTRGFLVGENLMLDGSSVTFDWK